jgi:hypothetical protein
VSGIPKVVKPEVMPHPSAGHAPLSPERGTPEGLAALSDEQQTIRSLCRVPVEVPLQVDTEEGRQGHEPSARFRLGVTDYRCPIVISGAVRRARVSGTPRPDVSAQVIGEFDQLKFQRFHG